MTFVTYLLLKIISVMSAVGYWASGHGALLFLHTPQMLFSIRYLNHAELNEVAPNACG